MKISAMQPYMTPKSFATDMISTDLNLSHGVLGFGLKPGAGV
jgi:hypothetical protein